MANKIKTAKSEKQTPTKKRNNDVNDTKISSISAINLSLSVFMLVAGILTPPLISRYFPQMEGAVSNLQFGKTAPLYEERGSDSSLAEEDEGRMDESIIKCDEENLSQFYHEEGDSEGAHIFCFHNETLNIYENYHNKVEIVQLKDWEDLMDVVEGDLGVAPHQQSYSQPWAFFSITGERLVGELDDHGSSFDVLKQHGMVLLFEGGSFIFPGVRIGFKRRVDLLTGYPGADQGTTLEIETVSMKPLVVEIQNFITEKECDHIQRVASPEMQYSEVSLMDHDKGRPSSDFRTSQSMFLKAEDEVMHALEARTSSITRVPKKHQEYTQVLRYGNTEKYSAHVDYFDPSLYQQDKSTLRLIDNGRKNRLATVFWYLSDVEGGGHTVFPRFNGAPQPHNFDDCTKGLLVKPQKGKVIIFYSLLPNGKMDELSLHGACPVKEGIKWAANKWVWNAPMDFVN